jgi:hypothetical protein
MLLRCVQVWTGQLQELEVQAAKLEADVHELEKARARAVDMEFCAKQELDMAQSRAQDMCMVVLRKHCSELARLQHRLVSALASGGSEAAGAGESEGKAGEDSPGHSAGSVMDIECGLDILERFIRVSCQSPRDLTSERFTEAAKTSVELQCAALMSWACDIQGLVDSHLDDTSAMSQLWLWAAKCVAVFAASLRRNAQVWLQVVLQCDKTSILVKKADHGRVWRRHLRESVHSMLHAARNCCSTDAGTVEAVEKCAETLLMLSQSLGSEMVGMPSGAVAQVKQTRGFVLHVAWVGVQLAYSNLLGTARLDDIAATLRTELRDVAVASDSSCSEEELLGKLAWIKLLLPSFAESCCRLLLPGVLDVVVCPGAIIQSASNQLSSTDKASLAVSVVLGQAWKGLAEFAWEAPHFGEPVVSAMTGFLHGFQALATVPANFVWDMTHGCVLCARLGSEEVVRLQGLWATICQSVLSISAPHSYQAPVERMSARLRALFSELARMAGRQLFDSLCVELKSIDRAWLRYDKDSVFAMGHAGLQLEWGRLRLSDLIGDNFNELVAAVSEFAASRSCEVTSRDISGLVGDLLFCCDVLVGGLRLHGATVVDLHDAFPDTIRVDLVLGRLRGLVSSVLDVAKLPLAPPGDDQRSRILSVAQDLYDFEEQDCMEMVKVGALCAAKSSLVLLASQITSPLRHLLSCAMTACGEWKRQSLLLVQRRKDTKHAYWEALALASEQKKRLAERRLGVEERKLDSLLQAADLFRAHLLKFFSDCCEAVVLFPGNGVEVGDLVGKTVALVNGFVDKHLKAMSRSPRDARMLFDVEACVRSFFEVGRGLEVVLIEAQTLSREDRDKPADSAFRKLFGEPKERGTLTCQFTSSSKVPYGHGCQVQFFESDHAKSLQRLTLPPWEDAVLEINVAVGGGETKLLFKVCDVLASSTGGSTAWSTVNRLRLGLRVQVTAADAVYLPRLDAVLPVPEGGVDLTGAGVGGFVDLRTSLRPKFNQLSVELSALKAFIPDFRVLDQGLSRELRDKEEFMKEFDTSAQDQDQDMTAFTTSKLYRLFERVMDTAKAATRCLESLGAVDVEVECLESTVLGHALAALVTLYPIKLTELCECGQLLNEHVLKYSKRESPSGALVYGDSSLCSSPSKGDCVVHTPAMKDACVTAAELLLDLQRFVRYLGPAIGQLSCLRALVNLAQARDPVTVGRVDQWLEENLGKVQEEGSALVQAGPAVVDHVLRTWVAEFGCTKDIVSKLFKRKKLRLSQLKTSNEALLLARDFKASEGWVAIERSMSALNVAQARQVSELDAYVTNGTLLLSDDVVAMDFGFALQSSSSLTRQLRVHNLCLFALSISTDCESSDVFSLSPAAGRIVIPPFSIGTLGVSANCSGFVGQCSLAVHCSRFSLVVGFLVMLPEASASCVRADLQVFMLPRKHCALLRSTTEWDICRREPWSLRCSPYT